MPNATPQKEIYGQDLPAPLVVGGAGPRTLMTREGLAALQAELEGLQQQRDGEFANRLGEVRAFGASGNNDEYLQIMEEEAVLASRIASLERLLASATVAPDAVDGSGQIALGTTVEVEDASSGARHEWRLVGSHEGVAPDAVSASSPVGQSLIGRKEGEEVVVELPDSRTRTLKILSVRAGD